MRKEECTRMWYKKEREWKRECELKSFENVRERESENGKYFEKLRERAGEAEREREAARKRKKKEIKI